MDTQAFKQTLHKSDRYNRRGFGSANKRAQALAEAYQSGLIGSIRENGNELEHGRLKVKIAEAFGFCWGVERAVAMAYVQRWPRFCVCPLELKVLSHSPRLFFYATAYIIIKSADEPFWFPDEYVVSIRQAFPRRRFSTAVQLRKDAKHRLRIVYV